MKTAVYLTLFLLFLLSACGRLYSGHDHTNNTIAMDTSKITNPIVKSAVDALQAGDKKSWFALFEGDASLYDDGNKQDFKSFFEKALGHERFTSIDKVENDGLDVYGRFHSDSWGDFKTYFKFHIGDDGKIIRLDIGQADY